MGPTSGVQAGLTGAGICGAISGAANAGIGCPLPPFPASLLDPLPPAELTPPPPPPG